MLRLGSALTLHKIACKINRVNFVLRLSCSTGAPPEVPQGAPGHHAAHPRPGNLRHQPGPDRGVQKRYDLCKLLEVEIVEFSMLNDQLNSSMIFLKSRCGDDENQTGGGVGHKPQPPDLGPGGGGGGLHSSGHALRICSQQPHGDPV